MNPYLLIDIKQKYVPNAPKSRDSTYLLLLELSHRAQIICGLEAAKKAVDMWEEYAINRNRRTYLTKEEEETPRKTVEIVEKWLDGKATIQEVKKIAKGHFIMATRFADNLMWASYYPADAAVYSTTGNDDINEYVADTVADAIAAAAINDNPPNSRNTISFYIKWWAICYPLIQKELQDKYAIKYDALYKEIQGDFIYS